MFIDVFDVLSFRPDVQVGTGNLGASIPYPCIVTFDFLTHISLAAFLRDIGKQHSPRCDATERWHPIWGYSVCLEKVHQKIE